MSREKRLIRELQSNNEEPNPALLFLKPVSDDNLSEWTAVMRGVQGTAYEDGLWSLEVSIPQSYPNKPPQVKFTTPICHPNIHFQTGEICLDLLKGGWTPAYTISSTLSAVQQLLTSAEPESPLNVDVAQLMRAGDLIGAEAIVRFWTARLKWEGKVPSS